jgi:hypothetical protein
MSNHHRMSNTGRRFGGWRLGRWPRWSGIGNVEAHADDIIMVNPGEMHDGMPLGDGPRE